MPYNVIYRANLTPDELEAFKKQFKEVSGEWDKSLKVIYPVNVASEQLKAAKKQLDEAADMLNEVKRYRAMFYKQRVANWEAENKKIFKKEA